MNQTDTHPPAAMLVLNGKSAGEEAARVAVSTVSNAVGAIVAEDGRLVLPLLAQPLSSAVAIPKSRCLN